MGGWFGFIAEAENFGKEVNFLCVPEIKKMPQTSNL
jgi:hypothetical protein